MPELHPQEFRDDVVDAARQGEAPIAEIAKGLRDQRPACSGVTSTAVDVHDDKVQPGRRTAFLVVTAVCAAAGCSAPTPPPPPPAPSPVQVRATSCPRRLVNMELHGHGTGQVSLWALVLPEYPVTTTTEAKIIWRMTGSGDLTLLATGPDGRAVGPTWGPEQHQGSNWERPGEEWGSGFIFSEPGCWQITASRGSDQAVAGILVTTN